jgi:hypothetical protein
MDLFYIRKNNIAGGKRKSISGNTKITLERICMSKPSHYHEAMVQAFNVRLQQLFPEPQTSYKYGKGINLNGTLRKPDLLLSHNDGTKWVYEMVHSNHRADHLIQTNQLYVDSGIECHWILYETLSPLSKVKRKPQDQYNIAFSEPEQQHYKLALPQRTILEMQTQWPKTIFAFTPNRLGVNEQFSFALGNLYTIGIYKYEIADIHGFKECLAFKNFISLAELEFDHCGTPCIPPKSLQEIMIDRVMELMGLDINPNSSIPEVEQQFFQAISSPQRSEEISHFYLQAALELLTSEERLEIVQYTSNTKKTPPIDSINSPIDITSLLSDANSMQELSNKNSAALKFIEDQELPESFKKLIYLLLQSKNTIEIAELMSWQEQSMELSNSRKSQTDV